MLVDNMTALDLANTREEAKHYGLQCNLDIFMEDEDDYPDLNSIFKEDIYSKIDKYTYSIRWAYRNDVTCNFMSKEKGDEVDIFVGSEYIFKMPNGYGVRVEKSERSLGGTENKWQVMPLIFENDEYSVYPDDQLVDKKLSSKKGGLTLIEVITYILEVEKLDSDLKGYSEE